MRINNIKCDQFAGLKNADLIFEKGLNILLGPNEAGKSTTVASLYSVLFQPSKVGFKSKEDKEFRDRYFPLNLSDSINSEVSFNNQEGDYILKRQWGAKPSAQLINPQGDIINNEDIIEKKLRELLMFGQGTYGNIIFAKQEHIRDAIERIQNDKDAINEIGSLLRTAVMELDGVSIDRFEQNLEIEIEKYLKRWDIDKNYPENNKGVNNQFKTGKGIVLDSYYKKEQIRLDMEDAEKIEKEYELIGQEINRLNSIIEVLAERKAKLEAIEQDVNQRAIKELIVEKLIKDQSELKIIHQKWLQIYPEIQNIENAIKTTHNLIKSLEEEKKNAILISEKKTLVQKIENVNNLIEQIADLKNEMAQIKVISDEDISQLNEYQNNILKAETQLKAGKIKGILKKSNGVDVIITKDLDEPIMIESGGQFDAQGYLNIKANDFLEIELTLGDINYEMLKDAYTSNKQMYNVKLNALNVDSIEDAIVSKTLCQSKLIEIDRVNRNLEIALGNETYESLMDRLHLLPEKDNTRSIDELNYEIEQQKKIDSENSVLIKLHNETMDNYVNIYESADKLFDKIIEVSTALNQEQENLKKLSPLPAEFLTAIDFQNYLRNVRDEYEAIKTKSEKLNREYLEYERKLPSVSFEELKNELEIEEMRFEKSLDYGRTLVKIKNAFHNAKSEMDQATFTNFLVSFSRYLSSLTQERYKVTEIQNGFDFCLEHHINSKIPVRLLSAGTYDSVALAFRLAIVDYIFGENDGFLILDDCLVDMDPIRKAAAINVIQEFSKFHQVIFSTCNPETAKELNGSIVRI